MKLTTASLLTASLSYAGLAHAELAQFCSTTASDVCFSVGVPEVSARAGSGNIYFSITAPTTYSWVSLGTGSQMAGSNLFVVYQDGSGNMTLSPRRGTQRTTPSLDTSSTAAQLTLLAGSGVSDDGKTMTANIRCSNCQQWQGGEMSLSGTSTSWVSAWRPGQSLATKNRNAGILQHSDTQIFTINLSQATIEDDSNPYVGRNAALGGGSGTGGGSGGSSTGNGVIAGGTSSELNMGILAAHGILMAVVFVAMYPIGSLLMPLAGKWWAHAAFQNIAFVLMWIGFGTGYMAARDRNMLFNNSHTLFGTIIVCLLAIQPLMGYLHHRHFVSHRERGPISYAHIWWGRIFLALGVVNGGLGLQLAAERTSLVAAYSVIAVVTYGAWIIVKMVKTMRNRSMGSHK